MKENLKMEMRKRIYEFFYPSIENIMDHFAIEEKLSFRQEDYEELMRSVKEWEKGFIMFIILCKKIWKLV